MQSKSFPSVTQKHVIFFFHNEYSYYCFVSLTRINALNCIRSSTQYLGRAEKHQMYKELKSCLDIMETVEEKPLDEVVGLDSTILTLLKL